MKISVKGSMKKGEGFIQETNYLSSFSNYMEIGLNYPHDSGLEKEIKFLKSLIKKNGMRYTVHAQYLNGNLNDFNRKIRRDSIKEVYYSIDVAQKIEADVVTLHPALEPYGVKMEERKDLEIDSYQKIAKYAQKRNIKIGLENLTSDNLWIPERAYKFELLLETIKQVNYLNFRLTLDIGHANTSKENFIKLIEEESKNIFHIHAHDNLGDTNENMKEYNRPDPHLPPGQGNVDWEKVIDVLEKVNYENYFELECGSSFIEEGVNFIKKII